MKKFQKTVSSQAIKTQGLINEKPKTDLITLLPQIIKILPQLGINLPFLSRNEPVKTPNAPVPAQSKPTSLMKEENQKAVLNSMEKHSQALNKIKNDTETGNTKN